MSTQYEGFSKKFSIHASGTQIVGVDKVAATLKDALSKDANTKVSIVESKKGKAVTFDFYFGKKNGALKENISIEEAVSFLSVVSGNRHLIRQRAVNVHRAFTEANVRQCYDEVVAGIKLATGKSDDQVHQMFIEELKREMGDVKTFDSAALTELTADMTGKKKGEISPRDRVGVLGELYRNPVQSNIKQMIAQMGYSVDDFIRDARNHHFVHYINRTDKNPDGEWKLVSGTVGEALSAKRNLKAIQDGEIEKLNDFVLKDTRRVAPKTAASSVIIGVHTASQRGPDTEYEAAVAELKAKGYSDSFIDSLSHKNAKELAEKLKK